MIDRAILAVFFLSGLLALGYQVVWSKFLLDFIGSSSYSYATVLASFMSGIAIGSWLLGKYSDRTFSALRVYAYLELLIGFYAVLYVPLSVTGANVYSSWVSFTRDSAGATAALGLKLLISFLLLVFPTVLMGGTFPLLLREVSHHLHLVGRKSSQLYSSNAFGAVVGALATNFIIVPSLGLTATLMMFALLNVFLFLISLFLARKKNASRFQPADRDIQTESYTSDKVIKIGLTLIFVEGVLAFLYEIAWTRYFGIVLGSSSYSFAIMLAAFISGIAIGSAWLSRREARISNVFGFWGAAQVIAGLLVLLPLPWYPYLTWVFSEITGLFSAKIPAFYINETMKLFLCFLIMLPPTIPIGMALPLMMKGLTRSLKGLGRRAGTIYAWNTWGNVTGAVVGGLFLLSWLGVEKLILFSSIATIALGSVAIAVLDRSKTRIRNGIVLSLLFGFVLVFHLMAGSWDTRWFTQVAFRRSFQAVGFEEKRKELQTVDVLLFEDDPASHLMVARARSVQPPAYGIYVNGKADASSTESDMTTQVLLGQTALLLHPDPKEVLVVGLATGVTLGSALTHPIRNADVVDIVQKMPRAAAYFDHWNQHALKDPRVHFIADDARSYLSYTSQKYDVIISEPSNPWVAGVSSLFTQEYYERAAKALSSRGIFLQWVQGYEMSNCTMSVILRTFKKTFPYVYGFQGAAKDLILLGLRQPLAVELSRLSMKFAQPKIRNDLERIRIHDVSSFLFLQKFSPATIQVLSSICRMENTDDNRFLEYTAPRDFFLQEKPSLLLEFDERLHQPANLLWHRWVQSHPQNDSRMILSFLGRPGIGIYEVFRSLLWMQGFENSLNIHLPVFREPLPSVETVTKKFSAMFAERQVIAATEYLDEIGPAILLDVSAFPSRKAFWDESAQQWLKAARNSVEEQKFRAFWIDLLLSSGQSSIAADEILSWMQNEHPPEIAWTISRVLSLGKPELINSLISMHSPRSDLPFLEDLSWFGTYVVY